MTLKQFLKPDWRKIVLTLFIFLIIPWPLYYVCISHPILNYCILIGWEYYPIIVLFFLDVSLESLLENILLQSYFLVIYFIISYLLSCLIIWIYDRRKKR